MNLREIVPNIAKIRANISLEDHIEIAEKRKLKDIPNIKETVSARNIKVTKENDNPDIGLETSAPSANGMIE